MGFQMHPSGLIMAPIGGIKGSAGAYIEYAPRIG